MTSRWLFAMLFVGSVTVVGAGQFSTPDNTRSLFAPSMDGRETYRFYCASCHGRSGIGDGPVAPALKTPPGNLTTLALRNGGRFPRQEVEAFVTNGKPNVPAHGSTDMPVWGPTFRSLEPSDREVKMRIANVLAYVESIQAK